VSKDLVWIKEKSLNFEIQTSQHYNTNQTCKDFIQASEIHHVLQIKHCSCYSDTRGVTIIAEHRGSSFVPHRSEDRQEIEMLKESLRQWDKAMWQWDDFYAFAFA
jgi:hypothetical protein